jgi:hypothetical protein
VSTWLWIVIIIVVLALLAYRYRGRFSSSRDLSGFRVLDLLNAVGEQMKRTLRGDDQPAGN